MQTLSRTQEGEVTYGGFVTRLLAYAIDFLIVGVVTLLVKNIVLVGFYDLDMVSTPILCGRSLSDMVSWLVASLYFVLCTYYTETTVGKSVMRIKVVGRNGEKLSLFHVVYRETVGRFLSSFLYVGYLLILIDSEKAALHDRLSDSRVVYGCSMFRRKAPTAMAGAATGMNVEPAEKFAEPVAEDVEPAAKTTEVETGFAVSDVNREEMQENVGEKDGNEVI